MSKIGDVVQGKIVPAITGLSKQRHLSAVSNAFFSIMGSSLLGSIALLVISPPVDYTTMDPGFFRTIMEGWAAISEVLFTPAYLIYSTSMDYYALFVAFGVGYFLSQSYKMKGLFPAIMGVETFMICCGLDEAHKINSAYFGGTGMFAAMLIPILTIELMRFLLDKKVGRIDVSSFGMPPALAATFETLVPSTIVVAVFTALSVFFTSVVGTAFPGIIGALISPLVSGFDSLWALILFGVLVCVFWWFGVHDTVITNPLGIFWSVCSLANQEAYVAGTAMNNLPYTFTSGLWWTYMAIGGSGATLGLCICLLLSRSKQLKTVGKLGIVPGIFNINEPVIFGLPVMLNPTMLIPFIGAMTANGIIAYLAIDLGIVNQGILGSSWNMPAPLGAFMSTLDWKAAVLACLLIVLDVLIYFPFVRTMDKQALAKEAEGAEVPAEQA